MKSLRLAGYTNLSILEHDLNVPHIYRVDNYFITKENPETKRYLKIVLNYCKKHSIEVIIPTSTWQAEFFSKHFNEFNEQNIFLLVNHFSVISLCNDKWETYKYLKNNGFYTPNTIFHETLVLSKIIFPVVIKPVVGKGNQNVFIVREKRELKIIIKFFKYKLIPFIVQEYIDNVDYEYTVGVVSDNNCNVIDSIVMNRYLWGGATGYAKVIEPSFINKYCEKIAKSLNSRGPLNIQLRLNKEQKPYVFEINPRFSGSAPMRSLAGFNEIDMVLRNFVFDEIIPRKKVNPSFEFFRVFQEVIIDRNSNKIQGMLENLI